jgi:hypothetical protein
MSVPKPGGELPVEPPEAGTAWLATVAGNGQPHLVPLWFVWLGQDFFLCVESVSVKARNLEFSEQVALAIGGTDHPLICRGRASFVPPPWPEPVVQAFLRNFEWNVAEDPTYDRLVRVRAQRWVSW